MVRGGSRLPASTKMHASLRCMQLTATTHDSPRTTRHVPLTPNAANPTPTSCHVRHQPAAAHNNTYCHRLSPAARRSPSTTPQATFGSLTHTASTLYADGGPLRFFSGCSFLVHLLVVLVLSSLGSIVVFLSSSVSSVLVLSSSVIRTLFLSWL